MCQGEKKQNAEKPKSCGITAEWFHLFISYYLEPRGAAAGRVCVCRGKAESCSTAALRSPQRGGGRTAPSLLCPPVFRAETPARGLGGSGGGRSWAALGRAVWVVMPPGSAELRGRSTGAHGGLGADPTRRGCGGERMAKGVCVGAPPVSPLLPGLFSPVPGPGAAPVQPLGLPARGRALMAALRDSRAGNYSRK